MRLKLTLQRGETSEDLLVTLDAAATVGDLANAVHTRDPTGERDIRTGVTIRRADVDGGLASSAGVLDPDLLVLESGLRSGSRISVVTRSHSSKSSLGQPAALLRVLSGRDAGREFQLPEGASFLGRDPGNDIVLSDPLVSKRHARLRVGGDIEIFDLESANGVIVDGQQVSRGKLTPDQEVLLGDTLVAVLPLRKLVGGVDSAVDFNRPPLVRREFAAREVTLPDPPGEPRRLQVPVLSTLAPLLMGAVLFAFTQNILSVVFVAMSPLLVVGSMLDQYFQGRRESRAETAAFDEALTDVRRHLDQLADEERRARLAEAPSHVELVEVADRLGSALWNRRPDLPGFLTIRLGTGRLPSRTSVRPPQVRSALPGVWVRLRELQSDFSHLEDLPVVGALHEAGGLGISGPGRLPMGVARSVLLQLAALHAPAELALVAVGGASAVADWDWLKWLPHVNSAYSPAAEGSLANSVPTVATLVSRLEEILNQRAEAAADHGSAEAPVELPALVVVVMDDAPIDRSRLVHIAETGPAVHVHVVWVAESRARLPACCRTFVDLQDGGDATVGLVHLNEAVTSVRAESATVQVVERFSRRLSPVVDSGARPDDDSDLARSVSFLAVMGSDIALDHERVLDRWVGSDPGLLGEPVAPPRQTLSLRGIVGQAAGEPFHLDLRVHGPHALVGGTTGSGKSEFLQAWVLGMATTHSPRRLNFLFVDYKGGSAFANCVSLPHTVGLVTDLRPHLVRRALTSLRAELRHRERILERRGAKDLIDLEKRGDVEAPPSLVIIVDEFAALVQEVPAFIDGVVDVAQRGRSLGLHLVLATQQPSGVIKGNLRANTNLRVALRMADADDSNDVLGDTMASAFDPAIPGRAAAKTGEGRLTVFQSLYAGGVTASTPPRPSVEVQTLEFGMGQEWLEPESERSGPAVEAEAETDISRVVSRIGEAFKATGLDLPRRPWLAPLDATYDLAALHQTSDASLALGVQDDPSEQARHEVAFRPDVDGNMAVFGTGGSGKSTVLRTLAISAATTPDSGPVEVYGLDFGARGLAILEELPHVGAVISGDDHERVARLLRMLREDIESRSRRYAAVRAGTLTEYRVLSGHHDEPRVLVLLDGFGAFRQEYELGSRSAWFGVLNQIAVDGRPVGIHLVVSADRPSTIPPSLAATIQQRVVLRFADPNDYGTLNLPADVLVAESPPGRGMVDGLETQIAVQGGSANLATQSRHVAALAEELREADRPTPRPVRSLPERVAMQSLPVAVDGRPVVGMRDDILEPIGVAPAGSFLIVGPPASGRTTTLAGMVLSTLRVFPGSTAYFFGSARSRLVSLAPWAATAVNEEDALSLATTLDEQIKQGAVVASERAPVLLVIDSVSGFLGGLAEPALQSLVTTADAHDVFVLAEAETTALTASWGLGQALRTRRRGLALQPDDMDGQHVFRTAFPRMSRSEFPPGRGVLVDAGKLVRVQMAIPD